MSVELELITKKDIAEIQHLLLELREMLSTNVAGQKRYLREKELRKELGGISANTIMKWRVEGRLKPKRIGRVLFYSWDEVEKMLK